MRRASAGSGPAWRARLAATIGRGSERSFLLWSLGFGLAIRLAYLGLALLLDLTAHFEDEYQVARALVAGLGFSFDYYGLFGEGPTPGAFFPPAYVFNVYLLLQIFGSDVAVFVQNALLSAFTSLLLYALTADLFDRLGARLALLLSLVYPPFIVRITHGSPVYFKMFLMVALVVALQRLWCRLSPTTLIAAVGLSGLLTLSMPDLLAYLIPISFALVVRHGWRSAAPAYALVLLAGTALLLAPWVMRTWSDFGHLTLVSTNGGYNLYMGHNPETSHEVDDLSILELDRELGGELARAGEFERDRILRREALHYIRDQPAETLANLVTRGFLHWSFRPTMLAAFSPGSSESMVYKVYSWVYLVSYLPLVSVAAWGVWRRRREWPRFTPILLAFLYSMGIAMLFVVQTKMRLVKVEPFLFVFAAAAVSGWLGRERSVRGELLDRSS